MTNEAILRDTNVLISRRFTCASGTAIPKNTLLALTGDNTVATASSSGQVFAGISHADVNNSTDTAFNTETSITADKGAVYDLIASLAITRGSLVTLACSSGYPNTVKAATAAEIASTNNIIVGVALETASDGERINVEVFP